MFLKITLEGPLQSWGGVRVNGDYFPTEKIPTKSGVVGLIACVMGLKREAAEIESLRKDLDIYCVPYRNDGIITDYHVVNVSEKRRVYLADGGISPDPQAKSIITKRSYIQGGKFDIYITANDMQMLSDIEYAFLHPYWTPYLGRKSCPVSSPIIPVYVDERPENSIALA